MATYIKTLKEDNGDIVYPQTSTDAIYTSGGETLETRISKYVTAEDIAQSVASFGTVTTGMLDDDAITTAKIDDDAVTTAKIDDGAVTNAKLASAAVTPANTDLSSFVIIIDDAVNNSTFFAGTYSKQFSVSLAGTYLIMDCWCSTMGRTANASNTLYLKLDNTNIVKYRYDSIPTDANWGDNRRTLTGTQRTVTLTAGSHTISTSGNIYESDAGIGHMIIAIRIG